MESTIQQQKYLWRHQDSQARFHSLRNHAFLPVQDYKPFEGSVSTMEHEVFVISTVRWSRGVMTHTPKVKSTEAYNPALTVLSATSASPILLSLPIVCRGLLLPFLLQMIAQRQLYRLYQCQSSKQQHWLLVSKRLQCKPCNALLARWLSSRKVWTCCLTASSP